MAFASRARREAVARSLVGAVPESLLHGDRASARARARKRVRARTAARRRAGRTRQSPKFEPEPWDAPDSPVSPEMLAMGAARPRREPSPPAQRPTRPQRPQRPATARPSGRKTVAAAPKHRRPLSASPRGRGAGAAAGAPRRRPAWWADPDRVVRVQLVRRARARAQAERLDASSPAAARRALIAQMRDAFRATEVPDVGLQAALVRPQTARLDVRSPAKPTRPRSAPPRRPQHFRVAQEPAPPAPLAVAAPQAPARSRIVSSRRVFDTGLMSISRKPLHRPRPGPIELDLLDDSFPLEYSPSPSPPPDPDSPESPDDSPDDSPRRELKVVYVPTSGPVPPSPTPSPPRSPPRASEGPESA